MEKFEPQFTPYNEERVRQFSYVIFDEIENFSVRPVPSFEWLSAQLFALAMFSLISHDTYSHYDDLLRTQYERMVLKK